MILMMLVSLAGVYWMALVQSLDTPYTAYAPLDRTVFAIDGTAVREIGVRSGSSGYLMACEGEDAQELIALCNGFRYRFAIPGNGAPGIPLAMGGWSYALDMDGEPGGSAYYHFDNSWVKVGNLYFYGPPGYFRDTIRDLKRAESEACAAEEEE